MLNDPWWRIAVHEAGHAAAAMHAECRPTYAGLDNGGGGFTRYVTPNDPRTGLFIVSAGRAAEDMMCGPSSAASHTHDPDRQMATRYAERCAPTHYAGLRVMSDVRAEAANFVRDYADVINAIAVAIMQSGVIDGDTIAAIVERVFRDANPQLPDTRKPAERMDGHADPGWRQSPLMNHRNGTEQDIHGRPMLPIPGM